MKKNDDKIKENILKYFNKVSNNIQDNSQNYDYENKIELNPNEDDISISDYFIKHNKDIFENMNENKIQNNINPSKKKK